MARNSRVSRIFCRSSGIVKMGLPAIQKAARATMKPTIPAGTANFGSPTRAVSAATTSAAAKEERVAYFSMFSPSASRSITRPRPQAPPGARRCRQAPAQNKKVAEQGPRSGVPAPVATLSPRAHRPGRDRRRVARLLDHGPRSLALGGPRFHLVLHGLLGRRDDLGGPPAGGDLLRGRL